MRNPAATGDPVWVAAAPNQSLQHIADSGTFLAVGAGDLIGHPSCWSCGHGPEHADRSSVRHERVPAGAAASLPANVPESGGELVHAIDGPFWQEPLELTTLMTTLGGRVGEIAQHTIGLIPDVSDPFARLSIALRHWAGCLDAAKTIALETNSGPNTPEGRAATMPEIDARAGADPVYRAGVEAGPAFKRLRN